MSRLSKMADCGTLVMTAMIREPAPAVSKIHKIYDPEISVNILDLGLIYALDIDPEGNVEIEMTLTAPACPVAGTFPGVVESHVRDVPLARTGQTHPH